MIEFGHINGIHTCLGPESYHVWIGYEIAIFKAKLWLN